MTRKLKNLEYETHTMQDLENGNKTEKTWKMRCTHYMTWNMARNSEKREKCEIHKQDLGSGDKTEKRGK